MTKPKRVYSAYDRAYQAQPAQIKEREARNLARAHEVKKLGKAALKGKDVDHKKALTAGGSIKDTNLRVRSIHANRGDKTY